MSKVDPLNTFLQAESFAIASNLLQNLPEARSALVFTVNPIIVISALASELFLKCLLVLRGTGPPHVHPIKELFDLLDRGTKEKIRQRWSTKVAEQAHWATAGDARSDLDEALAEAGDPFGIRYSHEEPTNVRFRLGGLPEVLRGVIVEEKPDWDSIKRASTQASADGIGWTKFRAIGHPKGPLA